MQHRPSLVLPYCWRRLTYSPISLLHRRPTPAGARGNIDAAPASLWGRNSGEHKTLEQRGPRTLSPPTYRDKSVAPSTPPQLLLVNKTPRKKQKQRQRPTSKGAVKTKTMPNLQGCGQNVKNQDNAQPPKVRSKQRQHPTCCSLCPKTHID